MALPARDAGEMGGPQAASEPARFGTRWAETEEVVCPLSARPQHMALHPLAAGTSHMAPCAQRHFPASRVEWVSRDGCMWGYARLGLLPLRTPAAHLVLACLASWATSAAAKAS